MSISVRTHTLQVLIFSVALSLSACKTGDNSAATVDSPATNTGSDSASRNCPDCTAEESTPAYALAQGCYAIKNEFGQYLTATDDAYEFATNDEIQAEKFFFKPTRLGSFLLYDRDGNYLAEDFLRITKLATASERTEWIVNLLDIKQNNNLVDTQFTLTAPRNDLRFQTVSGKPALRNTRYDPSLDVTKNAITLVQQTSDSCTNFPEASLDATITDEFYQAKDPDQPIVGYADLHTHIGFPKAMGGAAMSGEIFHPYGIEHALEDCAELHGRDGALDFLESQHVGGASDGHNTTGYPNFTYWPNRSTNTHVQGYYRWIQRAYLGGLRVAVTLVTGNPSFCQLLGIMKLGYTDGGCSAIDAVKLQTDYLYDLQDYIDAQEGGPGKGWFRIVTSPEQARSVIADNKLAVILGAEHGTLFNCVESNSGCTEDYIDQKLEEAYDMGIRSLFPIHRFDNAFGGTKPAGGSGGAWMHLTGMMSTSKVDTILDLLNPSKLLFKNIGGHFWDMQSCPDGADGIDNVLSMKEFISDDFSIFSDAAASLPTVGPLLSFGFDAIFINKLKPLPDYSYLDPNVPACNQRGLQPIGKYLINRMADKGMILEIDHLSYATLLDTIDVLEERQYSGFVSSHGWLESNNDIRARLLSLGGILVPMNSQPSTAAQRIEEYTDEMKDYDFELGLGFGSDLQGVTSQTTGDGNATINYPFTSVDGMVTFSQPSTGNRSFNFAEEGIAHYGLYPEWLENFKQVAAERDDNVMDVLMNSAEAYIQMWERAEASKIQ